MEHNLLFEILCAYSRYLHVSTGTYIYNYTSTTGLQLTLESMNWKIYFDKDFSTKKLCVRFDLSDKEPDRAFVLLLEKAIELRDTYNLLLKKLT